MKSTKDMVFEFVRQYVYTSSADHTQGVETGIIARELSKQRSNISAALNELIKEGKLVKTNTRPVLYRLPEPPAQPDGALDLGSGIGMNGSLRGALQQAKAAIRYPKNPLNILISAKSGCGTSSFVNLIYRYAVQNAVLRPDVPLVKINCRHYAKNISSLDEELFGTGNADNSCFERARGGMLFIDGFDLLDARQQSRVFAFLDTKTLTYDNGQRIDYSDVYLILSCSGQNLSVLKRKIPMIIELPELHQRPLEERFALINHFFCLEAKNLKRNIEVTAEAVKVLLITEFPYNIKELRDEILKACVNAYARSDGEGRIAVGINDFSLLVQQNLLELKKHEPRLERLLDARQELFYDREQGYQPAQRSAEPQQLTKGHVSAGKPVVLYVMHGSGTARSLRDVTNTVTGMDNAFSYDLDLDRDVRVAKEELKKHILNIDRGGGIIAIYDMGSIKPMLEGIAEETGIKICSLHIPITLLGLAAAQKCYDESDVDMVYHDLCKEVNEQRFDRNPRNSVIITLCHTGAEGAKYLKDYIDQHSRLGIKTIALNISGRKILLKEAMELKRSYHIHAFVGTYDPKLLGIPYIPASKLLNAEPQNIDRTLLFEPVRLPSVDYSRVYGYLQEQLKFASVAKLKHVLPNVVDEMMVMYDLDSDQMQGIFIHLACVVERLLSGGKTTPNPQAQQIIEGLPDDCRAVVKILRPLERAFKIIIDDNEIATLLMMLKKI